MSFYIYKIIDHFHAAHNLLDYDGECKNIHGHTWKIIVKLSAEKKQEYNKTGMVVDFKTLKKYLKEIIDLFDHKYLNDVFLLDKDAKKLNLTNTTAENIAELIFYKYSKLIDKHINISNELKKIFVIGVQVWETNKTCVSYTRFF